MEKVLVVSLLVLAFLRSASTEEKFIREGSNVTLDLRPAPSVPITIIQWKFKDSILAEWIKAVLPLTHNRNNIKLEIVNGSLSMEKMTKAEEGVYSVEVNNNVQKVTYNVLVIKDVPKPVVWIAPLTCSHESEQCSMTCEGYTTGAEPVTYSWKTGDGVWKESRRDMPITKKEHGDVKTFTCKMENPVSEEVSDPLRNILYTEKKPDPPTPSAVIVVVVVLLVVAVIVIGLWLFRARKNKNWPFGKRNVNPESPAENGNVTDSNNGANEGLLNEISTSPNAKPGSQEGPAEEEKTPNQPHEEKPVSKDEPTGEPADPPNPPHEEKPVSKEEPTGEPADPPKHEEKSVIKDAGEEEEADAKRDTKL